jgi:hypothetical protein
MTDKTNGDNLPVKQLGRGEQIVVHDSSSFNNFLDTAKFEHLWRVAQGFSQTAIVPEHYRGKPWDCALAIHMAIRLNADPVAMMQGTHIIKGRFGMEGKLAIALINGSGYYDIPLQFEIEGEVKRNDKGALIEGGTMRCRAWTKKDGERIDGMWVEYEHVIREGWHLPKGSMTSKWETLPELMFRYRAGTFFGRVYCPERLMGMQTAEEIQDVKYEEFPVERIAGPKSTREYLDELKQNEPPESPESDDPPEGSDTTASEESDDSGHVAAQGGDSNEDAEMKVIEEKNVSVKEEDFLPDSDTETGEVDTTEQEIRESLEKQIIAKAVTLKGRPEWDSIRSKYKLPTMVVDIKKKNLSVDMLGKILEELNETK